MQEGVHERTKEMTTKIYHQEKKVPLKDNVRLKKALSEVIEFSRFGMSAKVERCRIAPQQLLQ